MSAARLIDRLGRELRDRSLAELIGRRIAVASLDAIEATLRAVVAPWVPPQARWHASEHALRSVSQRFA